MYSQALSDLIITRILSVNTVYTEAGLKKNRMQRDRWAIVQKYEGETEYRINEKTVVSDKCSMVILPKGAGYSWICKKSGNYCMIEFDGDKTYDDIFSFKISSQLSDKILRIMKDMEYKRTLREPFCDTECIKDTYDIILRLCRALPKGYTPSSIGEKISPAVEFMAKHYDVKTSNDDLASLCGISTVYFRKLFTEQFGISPISYLHSVRIQKAKEMLSADCSITDIATSLGYPSIYDFSRAFKKYTGLSPTKYIADGDNLM